MHMALHFPAVPLFVEEEFAPQNADTFRVTDRRPSVLTGGERYP